MVSLSSLPFQVSHNTTVECLLSSQLVPVPIYGEQRHVCEQLAQSCYVEQSSRDLNLWLLACKSDFLTTIIIIIIRQFIRRRNISVKSLQGRRNKQLVARNMLLVRATCCRATCCVSVNSALGDHPHLCFCLWFCLYIRTIKPKRMKGTITKLSKGIVLHDTSLIS